MISAIHLKGNDASRVAGVGNFSLDSLDVKTKEEDYKTVQGQGAVPKY